MLIEEVCLLEAKKEVRFMLFVKLLGDEGGELVPEGLEGLLELDLLDCAVFLAASHGQILSQLALDVLEQRNEGLHG